MTGQQLKNSILQLAIQGKLVAQDPNDEPASELLKRIRKEKEQLVKEGKLKKKDLVTTPIADEEKPFEVPKGWEWCRMEDLLLFVNGRAYKKDELLPSGKYKVLRVGNLFTNDSWYYSNLELEDEKYCYYGDLIYAWSASFGPHIWEGDKTIFHYHIWNVKYSKRNIYREYLYYFLLADVNKIKNSTTGSTMVHISMENMKPRFIPLPPLAEQHRIVEKIEQLLPLVEKFGKAQEELNALNKSLPEALKKSILQEAIMGRLVPQDPNEEPASVLLSRIRKEKEALVKEGKLKKKDLVSTPIADDEKPFEIPKTWEWCRLGEIITLLSGQDLTSDRYFDSERGLPYITGASHFVNGSLTINRWTETPTSVSHKGDLLITCKGTVGTMAYNNIGDIHIARQVMAISSIMVAIRYIEKFLVLVVPTLEKQARSIIPGISRDILLNTPIPLPPLSEQHRIVAKLEEILPKLEKL